MIRKFSILFAVLVAMCIHVRAQQLPAKDTQNTTGTISGQVVTDGGQPLAGASLFVRAMTSANTSRSTTSDAEGNFRLNGLEPGLYTITANAPAYAFETAMTYYRLGDSVRLELVRGGVIAGTVTNSSGEPVIGVRVRATRIRDAKGQAPRFPSSAMFERSTDDRGAYRIYGLLPGTYLVSAGGAGGFSSVFNPYDNDVPTYAPSSTRDNASEISVRSGEESTADIRYRGEPGYSVSGNVKLAGTSGATITLRSRGNAASQSFAFQPPGARGFAFSGLADGEYTLRAQEVVSGQSTTTPQFASSAIKQITVKGANVTGIELITNPLASISGRVVLEASKISECEGKRAPLLAELLVQLLRPEKEAEDEDPMLRVYAGSASPDAGGALLWRNLMPGKYRFEPRFYARYWYLQSITMSTTGAKPQKIDAVANWTMVKPGEQVRNVTVTLAEGAASIHGRLSLSEGATVQPGTTFYLVPAEADKAADVLRFFATEVASDGTFTLSNLPPGKYWALTQANVDAQIATLAKLREPETEAAAARTKLRRIAETKKAEIELKPCQNVADYQLKQ